MPNWVYNTLSISGKPGKIAEIKDKAYFNGLVFNFRAFVPFDYNDPDYQDRAEKYPYYAPIANHENFNYIDWMNDHWGTSNTVDSKIVFDEPGSIAYSFSTKWEPPVEFVNTLEKLYPDVEIFFDYLREIDDENCVDEYEPEEDLPEAEITQEENNQEKCEAGTNDTFVSESVMSDSAPTQVVADDDFGEWFESTIRDEALSKKDEYRNVIIMDDENIEMFKKLYGYDCQNGKRTFFDILLSFSRIIPEPIMDESDKNWFDNTEHDIWTFWRSKDCVENEMPKPLVGREREIWRYDNWGTSSEALYDSKEKPFGSDLWGCVSKEGSVIPSPLDSLLKGEYEFYTLGKPPLEIYKKMAADGLVFKASWNSDRRDEWTTGEGHVEDGHFLYHVGPITGEEKKNLYPLVQEFLHLVKRNEYHPEIGVKNREHLDQLIKELLNNLKRDLSLFGMLDGIENVSGKTIALEIPLDLNCFSISSEVTDLSNLFADFDVSPCPEKGWFCKIKLDVSRWDVSNVTKMENLFNSERVELIGLNRWDRSKVIDC